jgi:hypothetical protein
MGITTTRPTTMAVGITTLAIGITTTMRGMSVKPEDPIRTVAVWIIPSTGTTTTADASQRRERSDGYQRDVECHNYNQKNLQKNKNTREHNA